MAKLGPVQPQLVFNLAQIFGHFESFFGPSGVFLRAWARFRYCLSLEYSESGEEYIQVPTNLITVCP